MQLILGNYFFTFTLERINPLKFYPDQKYFIIALLVVLVTNIMTGNWGRHCWPGRRKRFRQNQGGADTGFDTRGRRREIWCWSQPFTSNLLWLVSTDLNQHFHGWYLSCLNQKVITMTRQDPRRCESRPFESGKNRGISNTDGDVRWQVSLREEMKKLAFLGHIMTFHISLWKTVRILARGGDVRLCKCEWLWVGRWQEAK